MTEMNKPLGRPHHQFEIATIVDQKALEQSEKSTQILNLSQQELERLTMETEGFETEEAKLTQETEMISLNMSRLTQLKAIVDSNLADMKVRIRANKNSMDSLVRDGVSLPSTRQTGSDEDKDE